MGTLHDDRNYPSLPSFPSLTSDLTIDSPNSRVSASPEARYYASRASYRSSIAESPLRAASIRVHDHSEGMHHELSNDFNNLLDKHRQSQLDVKYLNLEVGSLKREKGTLERQILRLQKRLEELELRNSQSIERARQNERVLILAGLRSNQIANALHKPSNAQKDPSSSYLSVPRLSSRFSSTTSASSAKAPSIASEHELPLEYRDLGPRQAIDTPAKARRPLHRGITTSASTSSLVPPPLPSLQYSISTSSGVTRSLQASQSLQITSTSQEYAQVPRIRTNPNPLKRLPIPSFTPSPTDNTKDTSVSDQTLSQPPGFKTSSYSSAIPSSEHRFHSNTYTVNASRASTSQGHKSLSGDARLSVSSQSEHPNRVPITNPGVHSDQNAGRRSITERSGQENVGTGPLSSATVSPSTAKHRSPPQNDSGRRQVHRSGSRHTIGSSNGVPMLSPNRSRPRDYLPPMVSISPSTRTGHKVVPNHSAEKSLVRKKSLGITLGLPSELLASRRPLRQSTIINHDSHHLNQGADISPRDRYARGSPKLSQDHIIASGGSSNRDESHELQDSIDTSPTIKVIAQPQSSSHIHQRQVNSSTMMNSKDEISPSASFSPIARFDPSRPSPNLSTIVNTSTQGSDSSLRRTTDSFRGSSLSELSESGFASSPPPSPSPTANHSSHIHSILAHREGRSSNYPLRDENDSPAIPSSDVLSQPKYRAHQVGLSLSPSHRTPSIIRTSNEQKSTISYPMTRNSHGLDRNHLQGRLTKSPRISDLKGFVGERQHSLRHSISKSQWRDSPHGDAYASATFGRGQFTSPFSSLTSYLPSGARQSQASSTPTQQRAASRQYPHEPTDNPSLRPTVSQLHNAFHSPSLSRLAGDSGSTTDVDSDSVTSSSVRSFSMGSLFSGTHLPDLPPLPPTTPSPIAPPGERYSHSLAMALPRLPQLRRDTESYPSSKRPTEGSNHVFQGSSRPNPRRGAENVEERNDDMASSTKSFDDAAKNALNEEEYDMLVANIVRYDRQLIDQHVLLARARQIFLAPESLDLSQTKRHERQEVYDRLQRLLLDLERELELLAVCE